MSRTTRAHQFPHCMMPGLTRHRRIAQALFVVVAAAVLAGCGRNTGDADDCEAVQADLGRLLTAGWSEVVGAGGLVESLRGIRMAIERQLVAHDEWVGLGWCAYRAEDFETADAAFAEALARVRHSADATLGRGFVALRRDDPGAAATWFGETVERSRGSADATAGLRLAIERLADGDPAIPAALRAVESVLRRRPDDAEFLYLRVALARMGGGRGELRRRADAPAAPLRYFARTGEDYLELRQPDGRWQALFVKGVNVGPALPGRFPSEAPRDEATWRRWFDSIAALGANALRVYTLQPPAFYRALAAHNAIAGEAPLWLLQGVWADLPPGDDFDHPEYLADFRSEIARVIDAVHGDLVLSTPRGHAQGVFDTDVSRWTLAWIIGREWEPFAVVAFDAMNPGACDHDGAHVQVRGGRAMECWIGRTLDFAAGYEARRFGQGRPLTFANWPTLDPLHHSTEASRDEEDALRLALDGIPLPKRDAPAWDDDAISVDATLMHGAPAFPPGVFASYHVYPNFPYFMNLEPAFAETRDEYGVNRYEGYLRALKAYHGRQPVLVAEFGLSTSRGVAHLQPEGLHHGGLHEPEAMRQAARLARSIHATGMAGGVAFAFMDEWFKGTWSTSPFESPEDHRPYWFNAESPEQSYGLWAARPLAPVPLRGDPADWQAIPPLVAAEPGPEENGWLALSALRGAYDAGYLYLLLETGGRGPVDWTHTAWTLGIDTYDAERGERVLPGPASCETASGVEFAVLLRGPEDSELKVTPPYRLRHPAESGATGVLVSPREPTGRFDAPVLTTNRERFTRAGERIPGQRVAPGQLRFGSLDPASPDFDTRSDVVVGEAHGAIELRIPWGLLNFGDPSSGRVLHQPAPGESFGTLPTEGLRIYACGYDPAEPTRARQVPPAGVLAPLLELEGWVEPAFRLEPKHGLEHFIKTFRNLPDSP